MSQDQSPTPSPRPQGAHLVGSVKLPDAESVFRTAAEHLGDRLKRIPDGEVGERYYWIQFQRARFDRTPGLERVGDEPVYMRDRFDLRPFRLAPGADPDTLAFPPLGYADAAIESYATFSRLRDGGVIAPGTRFQVSLPTPLGVTASFFAAESRPGVERGYERAIMAELERILTAIPHDDLAIQWDTAVEFAFLEEVEIRQNRFESWFGDVLGGIVDRAHRQAAAVPDDVELGYHLCYGDVEEHHFVEPTDTATLAQVLTGLFAGSPRPVSWVHLPVPIERDDDEYFLPLGSVAWPVGTDLFLGLVHHEDGVAGARRRIETAKRHLSQPFGVATECGFGRGTSERTIPLLDLHAQVTAPWGE